MFTGMGFEISLFSIGLLWILAALIFDIKTKEVPNWLNFSFVIIVLVFRALYSIFYLDYMVFVFGVVGVGLFFVLANVLYNSKLFGGGDAKLLVGLGGVIFLAPTWQINLLYTGFFILLLLVMGLVYGLIASIVRVSLNWKSKKDVFRKEFVKQYSSNKWYFFGAAILFFASIGLYYFYRSFPVVPVIFILLIFPILLVFLRAIENVIFVKKVNVEDLRIGDWLFKDVKLKSDVVKSNFDGLTSAEISRLKKEQKSVVIRDGIVFVPAFLLAYLAFIVLWYPGTNLLSKVLGLLF